MCGLIELAFYAFTAKGHYKVKLSNSLNYLGHQNTPVPALENLDWPEASVVIRYPDTHMDPIPSQNQNFPDEFLQSRTVLATPDDLKSIPGKRVFIVGGSAAFGYRYHYSQTFGSLISETRKGDYTVINAAQVGWSSGRLFPVLKRIVDHFAPAAIILFTGNNEWVQWSHEKPSGFRNSTLTLLSWGNKSYACSYLIYKWIIGRRDQVSDSTGRSGDKFLAHQDLLGYRYALRYPLVPDNGFNPRDWPRTKADFLAVFKQNLTSMIRYCQAKGVWVILMNIPFNYKLSPAWKHPQPFYLEEKHSATVPGMITNAADLIGRDQIAEAEAVIRQVLALEPEISIAHYLLAHILEKTGRDRAARNAYAQSREYMIGNLGSMLSINESIRKVAESTAVDFVDIHRSFDAHAQQAGDPYHATLIHDDCHPNVKGHEIIARALLPYLD